jgi:alkylation response protein AidB-like acyl-CoA dehydrogenase
MLNAIDAARLAIYQAIAKLEDGEDAEKEISLAKILTDYSYKWTTLTAQQLHGGVAFMEEYDLQLWTRRARVAELKYESASVHRERYANAMGLT